MPTQRAWVRAGVKLNFPRRKKVVDFNEYDLGCCPRVECASTFLSRFAMSRLFIPPVAYAADAFRDVRVGGFSAIFCSF